MSENRLRRWLCAVGCAGLFAGSVSAVELVPVDLQVLPPGGGRNVIELTIEGDVLGTKRTSSNTATVSGNMLATLGIVIEPSTYRVASVETLEFTGGRLAVSDTSFSLNWGLIIGRVDIDSSGIAGTVDTPNPPGLVVDGNFNAADHELILNEGVFSAQGTGLIGGLMPENPYVVDLAANPISTSTDAVGSILVSEPRLAGGRVSYDVTLVLPVSIDETVLEESGQASVRVLGSAVLESRGQIVLAADFGQVAIPAWTGLEEAPAGATSYRRVPGGREIEWIMEALQVTTYAAVDGSFSDPENPQNKKQFHVNNASVVIATERIDTRGAAAPQIWIDLRTWDTSTGFEPEDGVTVSILASADGILFEEKPWLELRGSTATALNKGRDGAFATYRTPAGLVPQGVVRVKIAASTNSNSEHLFWDNLSVVSAVPFRRGDCDGSGSVDIADCLRTLLWLFVPATPKPSCLDACDANDDGALNVADPLHTLGWLFRGSAAPPAPGPSSCGADETISDALDCADYPRCP